MKIMFYTVAGLTLASTRMRVYYMSKELKKYGYECSVDFNTRRHLNPLRIICQLLRNDIIWFQKIVATPYLYIAKVAKLMGKKIIFDIDDSIYLLDEYKKNVPKMLKISDMIFAGSHNVLDFVKKFNKNAILIYTPIDTDLYSPRQKKTKGKLIVGWIGTIKSQHKENIKIIIKPIKKLAKRFDFTLKLVGTSGDEKTKTLFRNMGVEVIFIDELDWASGKEAVREISQFDIGLIPLIDTELNRGKGIGKPFEYMAMKIPSVASAVGEINYIIQNGYNGLLVYKEKDWVDNIEKLIKNKRLRKKIGENGRKTVEQKYSLKVIGKQVDAVLKNM